MRSADHLSRNQRPAHTTPSARSGAQGVNGDLQNPGREQLRRIAVHVCRACGRSTHRSEVNQECIIGGFVRCVGCGHQDQLNIEIRLSER